jgi:hypothetical protein
MILQNLFTKIAKHQLRASTTLGLGMFLISLLHVSLDVSLYVLSICFTCCFTSNRYPSFHFIPQHFTPIYHAPYLGFSNLFYLYLDMVNRYINYCSYLDSSLVYTLYSLLK